MILVYRLMGHKVSYASIVTDHKSKIFSIYILMLAVIIHKKRKYRNADFIYHSFEKIIFVDALCLAFIDNNIN